MCLFYVKTVETVTWINGTWNHRNRKYILTKSSAILKYYIKNK